MPSNQKKSKEQILEEEVNTLSSLLESYEDAVNANNIVSRYDLDGNITSVNNKFCEVSGFTMDELLGQHRTFVKHPDMSDELFDEMLSTAKMKKSWTGILKNRKKDGGYYYANTSFSPILDENDNIIQYISIRHDITEIILQRKELAKNLSIDSLTGIGNRFKLLSDIQKAKKPSLALINILNFREVNDFYGHEFGDLVIKEIAKRLESKFKSVKRTAVYRVQGDEYAILNAGLDKHPFIALIYTLIDEISLEHLSILSEEIPVQLTASLSFEENKNNLFTTADMMMHTAKREQTNILIYNEKSTINKEYENNIKWTKELKYALKEDRLVPFYQPIVSNNHKEDKYECLVRMISRDGEIISPFHFLEIAKRTDAYLDITKTMIKKSFEQFKGTNTTFSINLNIQDITDEHLKEFIIMHLKEYENGSQVIFEIVESEGINNFTSVIEFIDLVKSYGCQIAIDDFGTGYSNFEYLLRLKADYIKIDASMIKNLDVSEESRVVVSTIVGFAKKMNMKTIAEFVEKKEIVDIVKEMGIDYCQGYYFGEPKAQPEIVSL